MVLDQLTAEQVRLFSDVIVERMASDTARSAAIIRLGVHASKEDFSNVMDDLMYGVQQRKQIDQDLEFIEKDRERVRRMCNSRGFGVVSMTKEEISRLRGKS